MAELIVRKQNGEILFDTSKITYGLMKSGYMSVIENWTRRAFKGGNVDPNNGKNWTASTVTQSLRFSDVIYGFTVINAVSPIVFIVGSGCLQGTKLSGGAMTFLYTNASVNTKFYCFDLMRDIFPGGGYLKAKGADSVMSFNSLQPPLNIIRAIQAPPPIGTQATGYPIPFSSRPYENAILKVEQRNISPVFLSNILTAKVTINIKVGIEYAACLPWSRGCQIWTHGSDEEVWPAYRYGGSEGCGGGLGGIQFMFGPAGGTPEENPMVGGPGVAMPPNFSQVATDRLPTALVIETANLPFPFN